MKESKSQIYISNALIELLREKPFEKISVKDVSEKAFVSRACFYNHFAGVEELLFNVVQTSVAAYADTLGPGCRFDSLFEIRSVISMVLDKMELLQLLEEQGMLGIVPEAFAAAVGIAKDDAPSLYRVNALFYSGYYVISEVPGLTAEETIQLIFESRGLGVRGDLSVLSGFATARTDPRGQSTKRALRQALVRLAGQKPLAGISISELTKEAGVARCSFYRHYKTVEQFLERVLTDIFTQALSGPGPVSLSETLELYSRSLGGLVNDERACFNCLFELLLRQSEQADDDRPWKEMLLERGRCRCFAVRHLSAFFAFLPIRDKLSAERFSAML